MNVPDKPADGPVSIVALEFDHPVTTTQALTGPDEKGRIILLSRDAEVTGGETAGDVISVVTKWKIQHIFTTPADKLWRITAEIAPSAYNRINVSAPGPFGRSVTTAVQAWGRGSEDFTTVDLGILSLHAGTHALEFKSEMDDLRPLRMRRVWLSPIQ